MLLRFLLCAAVVNCSSVIAMGVDLFNKLVLHQHLEKNTIEEKTSQNLIRNLLSAFSKEVETNIHDLKEVPLMNIVLNLIIEKTADATYHSEKNEYFYAKALSNEAQLLHFLKTWFEYSKKYKFNKPWVLDYIPRIEQKLKNAREHYSTKLFFQLKFAFWGDYNVLSKFLKQGILKKSILLSNVDFKFIATYFGKHEFFELLPMEPSKKEKDAMVLIEKTLSQVSNWNRHEADKLWIRLINRIRQNSDFIKILHHKQDDDDDEYFSANEFDHGSTQ